MDYTGIARKIVEDHENQVCETSLERAIVTALEMAVKATESRAPSGQAEFALLDCKTIEACAKLLDAEAASQKAEWEEYLESGEKGPATTYYTLAERYAEMIRGLAI